MNAMSDTITNSFTNSLAIFGLPGGMEWIVILVIGLLIFGADVLVDDTPGIISVS